MEEKPGDMVLSKTKPQERNHKSISQKANQW